MLIPHSGFALKCFCYKSLCSFGSASVGLCFITFEKVPRSWVVTSRSKALSVSVGNFMLLGIKHYCPPPPTQLWFRDKSIFSFGLSKWQLLDIAFCISNVLFCKWALEHNVSEVLPLWADGSWGAAVNGVKQLRNGSRSCSYTHSHKYPSHKSASVFF